MYYFFYKKYRGQILSLYNNLKAYKQKETHISGE